MPIYTIEIPLNTEQEAVIHKTAAELGKTPQQLLFDLGSPQIYAQFEAWEEATLQALISAIGRTRARKALEALPH